MRRANGSRTTFWCVIAQTTYGNVQPRTVLYSLPLPSRPPDGADKLQVVVRNEIWVQANHIWMGPEERRPPKKWDPWTLWALVFFLIGLAIVVFEAVTEGRYVAWTVWFALPMLMFSLAYFFLISVLPIFLGPRHGSEDSEEGGRPPENEDG